MDRKSIFLALFIFIIIVFSLYFSFEDIPITPDQSPASEQKLPEEELQGVEFTIYNDQQNHQLQLSSEQLENFKSEQRMELKPVQVEVYNQSNNDLLYTLSGDLGTYFSDQEYIELRGNVVVESDRYHIESTELDYFLNRNYLEGRGSVRITGANFNSEAGSFNSDLNLKNLELSGNEEKAEVDFEGQ